MQKRVPIWVGGESGPALRRTAKLGDGWYPIGTNPAFRLDTLERFKGGIERLHRRCREAGRDPKEIAVAYRVTQRGPAIPERADNGDRRLFSGGNDAIIGDLRAFTRSRRRRGRFQLRRRHRRRGASPICGASARTCWPRSNAAVPGHRSNTVLKLGYKASAEQFGPRELLDFSVLAEEVGFDSVFVSDHFQPWKHTDGHAPNSLAWLGALGASTKRVVIGTSVATPTFRYHPSIVAQAFGTLGAMFPGRVVLGVGTGESLNEVPSTGMQWPGAKERRDRLREAIRLINKLWTEDRVTFEGQFYKTERRDDLRQAQAQSADLGRRVRPARGGRWPGRSPRALSAPAARTRSFTPS